MASRGRSLPKCDPEGRSVLLSDAEEEAEAEADGDVPLSWRGNSSGEEQQRRLDSATNAPINNGKAAAARRFAVCFWGVSRGLQHTIGSVRINVYVALQRQKVPFRAFWHTYDVKSEDTRSATGTAAAT
eukprot:gene13639-46191_t